MGHGLGADLAVLGYGWTLWS